MKKRLTLLCLALAVCLAGCKDEYDDTELWNKVNDHEERLAALEQWQAETNNNIAALQTLLNTHDLITSVTPVTQNGETVGYTISFLHSDPVTIYNGTKGEQGEAGQDGATPQIGLTKGDDGNWYWTLNGSLMRDADGNPIRANGEDGKDGQDGQDGEDGTDGRPGSSGPQGPAGKDAVAPQVRINEETYEWEISTDGGTTWISIGVKATGEAGDSLFKEVDTSNSAYVTFTLNDGTTFQVPRYQSIQIGKGTGTLALAVGENTINLTMPDNATVLVAQITPEGADGTYTDIDTRADDAGGWSVKANLEAKAVTVTVPEDGNTALLHVTLIDKNGSELTASRIVHSQGYKIENGTYIVYTAEGLQAWAAVARTSSGRSTNCTLAADITLPKPAEGESNWTPIGSQWVYTGTFDGAGHTVSGMVVVASGDEQGFFSQLDGTVKKLHLADAKVSGNNDAVGVIVGNNQGTIIACSVSNSTATVSSVSNAGIIAGLNNGTIIACSVSGNSTASAGKDAGIIVGQNQGTITACSVSGNTTVSASRKAGILAGYNPNASTITACYWASTDEILDGIGNGSGSVTKVDGTNTTWAAATEAMNAAVKTWNESNNNACAYHYKQTDGMDNPPVLVDGAPQ